MNYSVIRMEMERNEGIAWITLNRPDRLNVINADMRKEVLHALEEVGADEEVRVVVVQGEGEKAFSAGADITELQASNPQDLIELGEFFDAPTRCSKPVIAAIDGYALGGGLELALACDFRLLSKRSQVGQPEIHLGTIPGGGGTQRLARLLGTSRAKELCMLGERIMADVADQWGLADRVFANEEFETKVRAFARQLASRAPIAICLIKRVISEGLEAPLSAGLLIEREAFALTFNTEDMKEGVKAFLSKREPVFKGK